MATDTIESQFELELLCPNRSTSDDVWAFVVFPKDVSAKLPRRGRTSIEGTINGKQFQALLEPDGKKSHWLKIDATLMNATGLKFGSLAQFKIKAMEQEPAPQAPQDLLEALENEQAAKATWLETTAVAKVDWIHWIESAKQNKTRTKRINDACDMLALGKKRVCCFDTSGFYSKALSAPKTK